MADGGTGDADGVGDFLLRKPSGFPKRPSLGRLGEVGMGSQKKASAYTLCCCFEHVSRVVLLHHLNKGVLSPGRFKWRTVRLHHFAACLR